MVTRLREAQIGISIAAFLQCTFCIMEQCPLSRWVVRHDGPAPPPEEDAEEMDQRLVDDMIRRNAAETLGVSCPLAPARKRAGRPSAEDKYTPDKKKRRYSRLAFARRSLFRYKGKIIEAEVTARLRKKLEKFGDLRKFQGEETTGTPRSFHCCRRLTSACLAS